jgi:Tfp pilus assembly protein PilF
MPLIKKALLFVLFALVQAACTVSPKSDAQFNVSATIRAAVTDIDNGNYELAKQKLQNALIKDPNNIHSLYNLGVIYHSLGQFEQADFYYSRARKVIDVLGYNELERLQFMKIIDGNKAALGLN